MARVFGRRPLRVSEALFWFKDAAGHLGRRVRKLLSAGLRREQISLEKMMEVRRRWLAATDIQRVWRGHRDRVGEVLKEARYRMRCIVLVQGRWRMKKSRFLALVLGLRQSLRSQQLKSANRAGCAGRKRLAATKGAHNGGA